MAEPRLSIVTVVYNAVNEIEATILSVLNQQYPSLEYIIIDGGSQDGTVEIISRYADRLAYWCSEPDKGIYDAMNKGLSKATGDYIAFKNAGDTYEPNAFEIVSTIIQEQKPTVVYGNTFKLWQSDGGEVQKSVLISNHRLLKKRTMVDHRSAFVKLSAHRPFNLKYKLAADYDLFCELLANGQTFYHTHKVLSTMVGGGASDTDKVYQEIYLIQRQYYGGFYAMVNLLNLKLGYYRLLFQNRLLEAILGKKGLARFKARKAR